MNISEKVRPAAAVAAGGILYSFLNLIPIVGWIIPGATAAITIKKNPKTGFQAGVSAGLIGFAASTYILFAFGLFTEVANTALKLLIVWFYLLWHASAIFFSGCGGALASGIKLLEDHPLISPFKSFAGNEGSKYVVCKRCGRGNQEQSGSCENCGEEVHERGV
ncbi:MAG: hypothetical protein GF334_03785 [Candidatus Altiarchaeales archaeon]|nr:hypothetical protein [Candidatus Altiarchaeales archaeon]